MNMHTHLKGSPGPLFIFDHVGRKVLPNPTQYHSDIGAPD